ncbi:MAG: VOC family protein [SAR202 cluster bacterium]|nr:VOC family protein [SAR202 cluster bacterium]
MIKNYWHTGFVVRDIKKAIAFYRDGLGMHLIATKDVEGKPISNLVGYKNTLLKEAFFSIEPGKKTSDPGILALIEYASPRTGKAMPSERNYAAAAHIAFFVDDVDAAYQRLLAHGAIKLNPPAEVVEGQKSCYIQDPDGNWIELVQLNK